MRYCSAGGFFLFLRISFFVVDSRTFIEMNQIIGVSFHFSRWRLCLLARIFYICRVLLFFNLNTMPRNYDRLIRYYDSWFGDLLDPDKGFTPEECWSVIVAIRECQREITLEPLKNLPINIRRGLQMRTLETQILKILEHTGRMAARGSAGGNAAQKAAQERAKISAEMRERENEEREKKYQEASKNSISREQYLLWVEKGVLTQMGQPGPNWADRVKYALPETLERWKQWNEQQKKKSNE